MRSKFTANLLQFIFVLATFLVFLSVTSVDAQERAEGERPDPKAIADILNRIKGLEQEVNNLRGDRSVFAALESSYLGVAPTSNRGYFFVGRLVFVNLSSSKIVIKRDDIVLKAGGETYKYGEISKTFGYTSAFDGSQRIQLGSIAPRTELSIEPAATGSTWVRFTGIPMGVGVPEMTLTVNGDAPITVDVNKEAKKQLGLLVEQIGPRGSLAMLTITGSVTPINAGAIVDEITTLVDKKVVRAVIRWDENAPALDSKANSWLQRSASNAGKQVTTTSRSDSYPAMPTGLRELHLSSIPGKTSSSSRPPTSGTRIYKDDLSAVTAALKTAYERVPLAEVLADIENGSKLTRIAAISCGGGRLPIEKLPLLLKLADDEDPRVQQAAIQALGHFGESAAVEKLEKYVRVNVDPVSEDAITSLARSRFPAAHEKLLGILKNETPETRKRIVTLLAKNPRAAWADAIYEFASDPNSGLVIESTQALSKIGHPKLVELLALGMKSSNKALQAESFKILSSRQDAESEELAMAHMLAHMEKYPPTTLMLSLVTRTRDQRALPKLLYYFEKAKSSRQGLINAIAKIGDQSIVDVFVKQFPKLSSQEKTAVMASLSSLDWKQYRKLAGDSLTSSDSSLARVSAKALQEDGSDEAVELLTDAFIKSSSSAAWSYISQALSELRTPAARNALYKVMDSTDAKAKLSFIDTARKNMLARSPGAHYYRLGQASSEQEKYAEAVVHYDNAIAADPQFPEAYSARGYSRLKQSEYDLAISDFEASLKLDSRNGLAKASKSIALVEQGKLEEGVKQIETDNENFKGDRLFAYNSSCVYGTAMKQMKAKDASVVKTKTYLEYQKKALAELERSVEMGFIEADLIQSDPDLDLLRDLPEYKAIVDGLPKPKVVPGAKPGAKPGAVPAEKQDADKPDPDKPKSEKTEPVKVRVDAVVPARAAAAAAIRKAAAKVQQTLEKQK